MSDGLIQFTIDHDEDRPQGSVCYATSIIYCSGDNHFGKTSYEFTLALKALYKAFYNPNETLN